MKKLVLLSSVSMVLLSCGGWSEDDKKAYLDACTVSPNYKEYCECTLEKVMEEAPDPEDAGSVDIQKVAGECMDKLKM